MYAVVLAQPTAYEEWTEHWEERMANSGKVAIVTGSATGLGASCALDLAERGWNVAINYTKSKKEADETYEKVKAKGVEAILVQADMGQDADCRRLAGETMKKWGRVDGLINNAGTTKFQNQGDLDGVTPEDFDRILRVNVTGPYMMGRAVFPAMKRQWEEHQQRGSIVNISSIAGVMGVGSSIPYACSKGALNTLTLTLARWFSPAVRVNTVCPGFIQTRWLLGGMGEENYNKLKTSQEQTAPLRQAGTPEQMAEAVLFFLTSASNITGEFLIVDAGIHLASLPMKAR
jgi:3-oxoacyl-[acyl-carrier protein] reductase